VPAIEARNCDTAELYDEFQSSRSPDKNSSDQPERALLIFANHDVRSPIVRLPAPLGLAEAFLAGCGSTDRPAALPPCAYFRLTSPQAESHEQ